MKTNNQLTGTRSKMPAIAFVLCLVLILSLIPMPPVGQVFAEDPPPGPDPINIDFTINATNPAISSTTASYLFNPGRQNHVVSCPAITKGSIVFPTEVSGAALTLSGISTDYKGTTVSSINEGSISVAGNTLAFSEPFNRITLVAELAGEPRPYYFTFYQPGYSELEIAFHVNGTDVNGQPVTMTTSVAINHKIPSNEPGPIPTIKIPVNTSAASITAAGILSGSGVNIDNIGGAPMEYVVDREDQVGSYNGVVSVSKGFGKVVIHYFYKIGNSPESAKIIFYEADFLGIDVQYERRAGDYGQTSVVNVTSGVAIQPTSYVYFMNDSIQILPYNIGKTCTIAAITSAAVGDEDIAGSNSGEWTVTLPGITEPVTELTLTLDVEGEAEPRDVTLLIKRVLIMSTSYKLDDKPEAYFTENPQTTYGTPITTAPGITHVNGYGNFQTFLTVFGYDDFGGPNTVSIDHSLLVLYYKDDQVLGSREFQVQCLTGGRESFDRHEVLVFRESDPTFADVASANRVTAFVIHKAGALGESFGGATFGVGAGWGHLMPNHAEFGSGKDGMEQ